MNTLQKTMGVSAEMFAATKDKRAYKARAMNPLLILFTILLLAMIMTYFIDSGTYERNGKLVVPGSYQQIEKDAGFGDLLRFEAKEPGKAYPVSFTELMLAIPKGLERSAGLIFMVLIIGGMFGILNKSGAIDAGLEKLLSLVRGNVRALVLLLMLVFSAGSTFLGLASEYLLVIPLMVAMAARLGQPRIIGFAIVAVSVKIGYLASVTNPLPLTIAQPLVGLQIFSGAEIRLVFYLVFLAIGMGFMLLMLKKHETESETRPDISHKSLSTQHALMLGILVAGIGFLVFASNHWHWQHQALSAYYLSLCILLATVCGLGANGAADAFVSGMKKVLLASFLIGVAFAVAVVLEQGQILDSVVHALVSLVGEGGATVSALSMFMSQLLLDFLIPSTSGQAAVSMPIMGPIGQLSGVSAQITVTAFLFGNGITNMLTPTSGTLLAYLATAQVGWAQWARFILPLWFIFIITAMALLALAVNFGY